MTDSSSLFLEAGAGDDKTAAPVSFSSALSHDDAAQVTHDDYDGPVDVDMDGQVTDAVVVPELNDNPAEPFHIDTIISEELADGAGDTELTESQRIDLATEPEAAEEADDDDPIAAFRARLEFQPGDWFVIHSYAGFEKRVKQNLEHRKVDVDLAKTAANLVGKGGIQ